MKELRIPFAKKEVQDLTVGENVTLSGIVYTARDEAHRRLADLIEKKKALPFPLEEVVIYYCGPSPEVPGTVIGSCGPTTASRMDAFTPILMAHGLLYMIGKGKRSDAVVSAVKKHRGVYFSSYGGCGALLSDCVLAREVIAFPELGPEAIFRLEVKQFPVTVVIDARGNNLF